MVCLAVAMLLGIGGSAGAQQNASAMKALREKLLGEKSDMDPSVPPSTSQDNKVWVQFRIFKVLGVDLQSGRLRFKAWRRTRWFDDRLAWDPVSAWLPCPRASHRTGSSPLVHRQAEFDGLDEILVYPGSAPATNLDNKLWLPDIVTYASATSSSSHLTPAACTHAGHCLHAACRLHPTTLPVRYLHWQVQLGATGASDV